MPLLPTASLTTLEGLPYYIPATRISTAWEKRQHILGQNADFGVEPIPTSLFILNSLKELTADALISVVEAWLELDDVFRPDFLARVYILTSEVSESWSLIKELGELFQRWRTQDVFVIPYGALQNGEKLPSPGPYFTMHDGLHPAWRLFPDSNGAFVVPVVLVEGNDRKFVIPGTADIPVPSRCFHDKPSPEKPLSGLRVVIKDNIDMAGVPTGVGNRAFSELYGNRAENAECVKKLLAAGAVIVGRVKTVQFASGESAKDWFDYQAPFNPRGDGYQDPECSSAGSAVACAAYDWVDIAIGTDTIGSIIGPASQQGLFGLRPSLGGFSTASIFPVSKELDTVGVFARTAHLCAAAAKVLSKEVISDVSHSSTLQVIYPTDCFDSYPNEYMSFVEPFISKLESFLRTRCCEVDLGAEFIQAGVSNGRSMQDYLATTAAHLQLYDCYRNCVPFMQDYRKKYSKAPFVDPYIHYKWGLGKNLSDSEYNKAIHDRNVFRDWVLGTVLPSANDCQTLDKILVMPNGNMNPIYRHEYDGKTLELGASQKQGFGFKYPISFVVLSGIPFVNIPIGQFPYESTVTERTEYLPVNIGLVGPKGSEIALVELVKCFLESSTDLGSSVKAGSCAFAALTS